MVTLLHSYTADPRSHTTDPRSYTADPRSYTADPRSPCYSNISYFTLQMTRYPGKTIVYIGDYMMEFSSKQGASWLRSFIPTQQIHMLLVFFLYSVLSIHVFLFAIPLFLFYLSFLTLVICTLQMFYRYDSFLLIVLLFLFRDEITISQCYFIRNF